jgi:predicted DNA-binding transcriptional regulator YafY
VEAVLDKIESTFGGRDRERYTRVVFTHLARHRMSKDLRKHAATLSTLSRGCVDQKKVEVSYRSSGEGRAKTYLLRPYLITYYEADIYVIGHSELRDAVRTLRIDRIQRAVETNEPFERPDDFDPEEYILRGFSMYAEGEATDVRLEFRKHAARTVKEKEFHPSQRTVDKPGGKVEVGLTVQGLSEVARWVMYHAPNARVLRPKKLGKLVGDWAREVAAKHGGRKR